jgi:hypothetical protein
MFLVEEEGTASTFRALREVVLEHGRNGMRRMAPMASRTAG